MALFRALLMVWVCAVGYTGLNIVDLQEHGLYTLVLNSHLLKCTFNKSLNLDVSLVQLYAYDFKNDVNHTYYLNESAAAILNDSTFEPDRTIFLYVPGFNNTVNSSNQEVVRLNLKNVPNSYLYIVEHHAYTYVDKFIKYLPAYERSVKYYFDIGRAIAEFLDELVAGGASLDKIHVMGHSLGGQIIGAVGEVFHNRTGKLLPRISGADPAGPCFSKADTEFQLRSGLATHVETYHCNAGQLGTDQDLTDAYYYINGGEEQPGCRTPLLPEVLLSAKASSCSHGTCPYILTAPGRYYGIWEAMACDSEKDYKNGDCSDNGVCMAGVFGYTNNTGKYYFSTTGYDIHESEEM